jgi:fibronectin type 3 domain-containing protein
MSKRVHLCACIVLLLVTVIYPAFTASAATPQIKISVFNFTTMDLEASGYNTMVANMLMSNLGCESYLSILDRKELEAFLSMNDLQQDDNLGNVTHIGTRLGLSAVVVGSVGKKESVIMIHCKVFHVEQKRMIFETKVKALGNAGLEGEVKKLSKSIAEVISGSGVKQHKEMEKAATQCPLNVQKRSGAQWVGLGWEAPPGFASSGYEIFRSKSESGPFTKIAQVNQPEYRDQDLERNTLYHYKIRGYTAKGLQSDFSAVITAETALTPNPPIILKVEGHVKSIELTWSPSPIASDDKLPLKGYKLYRANTQQEPYKEVANILSQETVAGVASAVPDKLVKVIYLDKGLKDGEDYYYKLTSYNEKNLESDFSSSIKGVTIPIVSGLSAQGDMIREIKLMWNMMDSPFIKGYYIYRSISENENYARIKKVSVSDVGGVKKIEYTDREGLDDKIRYFYRVTAIEDSEIETSPSVIVSAVTKGKPATLQGLKAKSGLVKTIELTWPVSSSEEVEGYNLYVSKEKEGTFSLLKRIDGRAINSFVHGGPLEKLEDGGTYYYSMRTFNKVNVESELSETIVAVTKPRPAKPSGLNGEALKVKEVPLTWQPNPEKDIAVYHIYRAADPEDFVLIAKVSGKTSYQDKDLKDGTAYNYKIRAEDKDELISDFSDVINIQTKPKPKKIEGVISRISEGNMILAWEPGSEPDLTHYIVYEKRFFGLQKIDAVKITSFTEAAPGKGKSKIYTVTAVDKDGLESEHSQEVTVGEQ